MEQIIELLDKLEKKAEKVSYEKSILNAENERLLNKISILEEQTLEKDKIINELKRKTEVLKISGALGNLDKDRGSRARIDDLVREIDKCITLLK